MTGTSGNNREKIVSRQKMGKEKTNKHKEFWRDTPWFVSRLSWGHVPSVPSSVPSVPRTFCPSNVNFHINRPKRPGCPWDVPNLSPGRSRGIPTTKFLYVIFLYRFLFSIEKPKSAVYAQKTKKNRCLGIRCWDPNLSGGYQNCGLGIPR